MNSYAVVALFAGWNLLGRWCDFSYADPQKVCFFFFFLNAIDCKNEWHFRLERLLSVCRLLNFQSFNIVEHLP